MMIFSIARMLLLLAPAVLTNASVRGSLRHDTDEQDQSTKRELENYHGVYGIEEKFNPFSSYGSQVGAHHESYDRHRGRGSNHYYHGGGYNQHYSPYHHRPYEIPCSPKLTHFTAEVFVNFNGDPSLVTFKDVEFLEQGFRHTYNYMSKRLCDDKFREIHSATAIHESGESPVIPRGGLSFGLRYLVKGVCRGCSPDSPLFAPPLRGYYHRTLSSNGTETTPVANHDEEQQHGRQLWQPHIQWSPDHPIPSQKKSYNPSYYGPREKQVRYYYDYSTKSSKTKSNKSSKSSKGYKSPKGSNSYDGGGFYPTCTCKSPSPKWRPPTEAGFAKAFQAFILQFASEGGIIPDPNTSVEIVLDVTEIDAKSCATTPSDFESFLEIEFTGDFNALTETETSILENNILAVYNRLSDEQCDLLFRDVADVTLAFGEQADSTFTVLFLIDAECRGCNTAATTIFGDGSNRRELQPWSHHHSRPWYPNNVGTQCYCPIYGKEGGAPSDNAFEVAYRDAVLQLAARGDLQNVTDVVMVTEVKDGETDPPSAAIPTAIIPPKPSLEPSSQPSSRPSVSSDGGLGAPTIAPSANPTVTVEPSDQPSSTPSAAPSSSPTRRRSGMIPVPSSASPSSSPSESPSDSPSDSPSTKPSASPSVSISSAPSTLPSHSPSISQAPTTSTEPSSRPSLSMAPTISAEPSESPSISMAPSISSEPSLSSLPSLEPSISMIPSISAAPSESIEPSEMPSLSSEPSLEPSISLQPSLSSEPSLVPSISAEPSTSSKPSVKPSISGEPSLSSQPSVSPSLSTAPSESPSNPGGRRSPGPTPAIVSSCPQDECVRVLSINVDGLSRRGVIIAFPLGTVSYIQNVTVEVASEYGNDMEILLVAPNDEEYTLMLDTVADKGTGDRKDFDMGVVQGNGTLSNVNSYTFVEQGGLSGFTSPFSSTGTYNAQTWGTGTYNAGDWYFFVRDSAKGNSASIGQAFIRYCGTCGSAAPSSSPSEQPSMAPSVTQDTAVTDLTSGGRRRKKDDRLLRHRD